VAEVWLPPEKQKFSHTALPTISAPASSTRVTTVASSSGTKPKRFPDSDRIKHRGIETPETIEPISVTELADSWLNKGVNAARRSYRLTSVPGQSSLIDLDQSMSEKEWGIEK
jgi:hypothetical protein